MKQIILILVFLLPFGLSVYAQKKSKGPGSISEVQGQAFKSKRNDRVVDFTNAYKIDDEYYAIGRKVHNEVTSLIWLFLGHSYSSDFVIYRLDSKMNYREMTVIPAEFFGHDVQSLSIVKLGNRLCALFYFNNKKQKRQYLFAQMIDLNSLKIEGRPYKIAESAITKRQKNISCIFKVDVSDDHSKIFITTDRSKTDVSKREKRAAASQKSHTFSYWLINSEMELVNAGKNTRIGKGNTVLIGQVSDNAGNMCLLGYEAAKGSGKGKKSKKLEEEQNLQSESRLVMKIIKPNGEQSEMEFGKGEKFYSASMRLNPNTGNVAVAALIASGKGGAKGIFTQQVNLATGEMGDESIQLFGVDMVKEMSALKPPANSKVKKEKPQKKNKKNKEARSNEPADYIYNLVRLGNIHYNDSNEMIITTQKYYTYDVTVTSYDSKGHAHTYTVTYHVYGDIISFKLNPFGEIENFGYVFHRSETAAGDIIRDYSSLYRNGKIYIMTTSSGGMVSLDNKVSAMQPFKEKEINKRKMYFSQFILVSETEMLNVVASKKKLLFSKYSVRLD